MAFDSIELMNGFVRCCGIGVLSFGQYNMMPGITSATIRLAPAMIAV